MGRPAKRVQKELGRVLGSNDTQGQIDLLKRAFKPFERRIGSRQFESWLGHMEFFRKHDGKIRHAGKPRQLSKEEHLFFDRLDFFKEYISKRSDNPITSFPITILKRVLFDEIENHEHLGVSHEILDEHEGYLNPHARLYIEPGATIEDAREYLLLHGDEIRKGLNRYLPKDHHLRGKLRGKSVDERNGFVADLKARGVSAKEIQIQVSRNGYQKISINGIAKIKAARR